MKASDGMEQTLNFSEHQYHRLKQKRLTVGKRAEAIAIERGLLTARAKKDANQRAALLATAERLGTELAQLEKEYAALLQEERRALGNWIAPTE